jgi:tetratricopeptide (TPR) repeat protein
MRGLRKLALLSMGLILSTPTLGAIFPAPFQLPIPAQQGASTAYDLGIRLLREKRYHEALDQFKLLERGSPQLPQGYTGEGIALALMGKPNEGIQALRKALDIDQTFWVARRELGIVYWQLNQKDQAARELGAVVKLFPDDPAVNVILGQYEFERANYPPASAYFGKAAVQVAADARLSLMAAEAQLKSGLKVQAREALEALVATPALSPDQSFHLGCLLGEAGDYESSIHVLESLPDDFQDKFGRGYAIALDYYEEGRYSDCLKTLNDLRTRKIIRPELFSLMGAAEEDNHDTVKAYNAYEEGIYAFPTDDLNYLNIAALCTEHLNYELATETLTSGVQLIPNDYKLYLTRGVVKTFARQLKSAQADYEKALALAPEQGEVYLALGICYIDEDRIDEATATFRQGIRQQPGEWLLYYFLADSLFRKGLTVGTPAYAETLSAVETSLSINPDFVHGYLQRGRLELLNHELSKAVQDLEHAHSLAPDSREISYQLGIAYREAGQKAEAEKMFKTVTEASEQDAAAFRQGQLRDLIVPLSSAPH